MPDVSFYAGIVNSYLPEPHASLLNGIIFGIPLRSLKEFNQELKIVGLIHIVVLSGMNITLISAIIGDLTKHLGKKLSLLITIFCICVFIQFVGAQPPIIRAGFMGVLTLLAVLYGRKTIALYSLFLSAVFIAIFWPHWLSTVSLQLSYGATLGLILFNKPAAAPPTQKKEVAKKSSFLIDYIASEFRTSIAAQVFSVPIIFFYFKQVSLIAPLSNVLVAWIICPLTIFGFITVFLGSIHHALGIIPSYICYWLLSCIILTVQILAKIPYIFLQF